MRELAVSFIFRCCFFLHFWKLASTLTFRSHLVLRYGHPRTCDSYLVLQIVRHHIPGTKGGTCRQGYPGIHHFAHLTPSSASVKARFEVRDGFETGRGQVRDGVAMSKFRLVALPLSHRHIWAGGSAGALPPYATFNPVDQICFCTIKSGVLFLPTNPLNFKLLPGHGWRS